MTSPLALLTAGEMRLVDAAAGDAGFRLMQAAGAAVATEATRLLRGASPGEILVCAGPGNNGGDGAVAATALRLAGHPASLCRIGTPRQGSDAARAFDGWEGDMLALSEAHERLSHCALVVDALLGAGLSRPIDGELAELIDAINASRAHVLSVDLPSGLDGDRHLAPGPVVQADVTVTFVRYKPAHVLFPGRALCGERVLADIGMPDTALRTVEPSRWFNAPSLWRTALGEPSPQGHKYRRGHVLVRGGGLSHGGAARLAAGAALGCGAGLVTLACPGSATIVNASRLDAVMLARLDAPSDLDRLLEDARFTTLLLGPGNGVNETTAQIVESALASGRDCVLDADALTSHGEHPSRLIDALARARGRCVLTPHAGEFDRLFGRDDADVSTLDRALAAAARTRALIVFKGADTVVAAPDGRASIAGNAPPWLATAGAGDVLAGAIAALLAQGAPPFEAASAAVWLHGEAARTLGYPMTAEQLVQAVARELGQVMALSPPALPGGLSSMRDDG